MKKVVNLSIFLFTVIAFLSGCTNWAISEKEKASIHSVSINKHVEKPDSLSFEFHQETVASWGQAISKGIHGGLYKSRMERTLIQIWNRASIDIEKIVMEEFEKRLKSRGLFDSILPSGGDAEFTIEIKTYGFYSSQIDSKSLQPALSVEGKLTKSDGTILWKAISSLGGIYSGLPSYNLKDFEESPELMRGAINLVAERIVGHLIDGL